MSLYFKAYNILKNKFNYNIDYSGFITEFEEYISNKVKIEKSNEDKKKYLEEKKGFIEVIKEYSSEILYDVLVDKIKNEYYSGIGKSLDSYKENFMKLELKDKIDSIKILLRLTSGEPVDFKLIGGKSGQGRLCGKNMNYDWLKDVRFIEQSVTGIYKKEYMLNELENCNNIK